MDTLWFEVEDQCREWGDDFDTWQDGLGQYILGLREDGMFAASIGGVTLSIPRQVAKTFLVGRIVFALCAKFPHTTVIWTAHRTRTATQTFEKLKAFAKRPAVRAHLAKGRNNGLRDSHGEQEIRFANGSVIMFGAREQGFGRGFDEVDVLVFDEAQILTEKALEDMVAATNQSRFPHGALLFYMGTPPRPVDPGEVFQLRRDKAIAVKDARDAGDDVLFDALYVECSADAEVVRENPDDREQWAIANPSFPHRTPLLSMLRLRENLPSVDSWLREAMGVWDEIAARAATVFESDAWDRLAIEAAPPKGRKAYGVKFSADGRSVALAGSLRPVSGPVHVEGIEHRLMAEGTKWLVKFLADRWRDSAGIAIDGRAGAGAFVLELRNAGVPQSKIKLITTDQAVTANAAMLEAVTGGTVTHHGDPALSDAVGVAVKRPIGTNGGWGLQSSDGSDITLLEAVVLAHYAAPKPKREGSRSGRMLVLT